MNLPSGSNFSLFVTGVVEGETDFYETVNGTGYGNELIGGAMINVTF